MKSFFELNINNEILESVEKMGFQEPTPIQSEVIPIMLEKNDLIAQAPTGTGKTCAFGIPIIENLKYTGEIEAIILSPTRELAQQITNELSKVAQFTKRINIVSLFGGQQINKQFSALRKKPQIIVGTPGRVIDHINRKTLNLENVQTVVLDEADEMLNMGFREEINTILENIKNNHQTVLFSATMPKEILNISKKYQNNPVHITTKFNDNALPDIKQYYVLLKEEEKFKTLKNIIAENDYKLCIVFCATKRRTDELAKVLFNDGFSVKALHGDLEQRIRDTIMKKFRNNEINILVATDVAARGLDINNVEAIFNFDVPQDKEYYVHRIGRTARANQKGAGYTFVKNEQMQTIREIEKYTKIKMERLNISNNNLFNEKWLNNILNNITTDLKAYKSIVSKTINEYNLNNNTNIDALDIAAYLIRQNDDNTKLSSPSPREKKQYKINKKYFVNLGKRDKITQEKMKNFITKNVGVTENQIGKINVLDNYSFIEADSSCNTKILTLNGKTLNKRIVNIEEAKK